MQVFVRDYGDYNCAMYSYPSTNFKGDPYILDVKEIEFFGGRAEHNIREYTEWEASIIGNH
jgi:hypothetical protein